MDSSQTRIHRAALRLFAERGTDKITVSELAQAAGVARGTIYNNLSDPDALFLDVAAQLATEMNQRIIQSFMDIEDPAQRLARGIRLYIRRAHHEPDWGRFLCRFAFSSASLQELWTGAPVLDVIQGAAKGRYQFRDDQLASVMGLIAGSVLSAIFLVLEGHRAWRDPGSDTAELALRALGVPPDEARKIGIADLPTLPELAV